ncbi:MAG: NADH:flavin oxidoreductase [Alphaproteobacteria bacterium]|nr:NADH:flavin oxidoreductase [Alphaproteobacteria bacterium]
MTHIAEPLALPCGVTLRNRLAKAAMTEGLADPTNAATPRHVRLYSRWAESGCAMLLTGNVQIDRRNLERPGNVVIEGPQSAERMAALVACAKAGTANGTHLWMQISHAGRQTQKIVNPEPVAPSAVPLGLPGKQFGMPRALTGAEIEDLIKRFANAAKVARAAGFTGAQLHGAHGYLVSQFLSPKSNIRTDEWGGSLANRARFLIETLRAMRSAVGADFPLSVKLNSADFQKGGFSHEDSLAVVQMLNAEKIDLLEISGGTYEQPKMAGFGGAVEGEVVTKLPASTRAREAYFVDYAASIAKVAEMPLMVTGGFRSRAAMDEGLTNGAVDLIGIGRPLCGDPTCTQALLDGSRDALPAYEHTLRLGPGWLSQSSPFTAVKLVNAWGAQGWYCLQLLRMGAGEDPDLRMGVFTAFRRYMANEQRTAKALQQG